MAASAIALANTATGVEWISQASGYISLGTNRSVYVYLRNPDGSQGAPCDVYATASLSGTPLSQPLSAGARTGALPGFVVSGQSLLFVDALTNDSSQSEAVAAADIVGNGTVGGGNLPLPNSVENVSSQTVRQTIFVTASGDDSNAGLVFGTAKATIAGALTALGSDAGTIQLGYGSFDVGSGLTLAPGQRIQGISRPLTTVTLNTSGTAINFDFTSGADGGLADLTISLGSGATTATGLSLDNAFNCTFDRIAIVGDSLSGQTGLATSGNAGDNSFHDCIFSYCGIGSVPDSAMNYFYGCKWVHNTYGIQAGDATNTTYQAGMTILGGTFAANTADIDIVGTAGEWDVDAWFDGEAGTSVTVGNSTGGPISFRLHSPFLSAQTSCLVLNGGRQIFLDGIKFEFPVGYTPTELTIGSGATNGTAINLVSAQSSGDPFTSVIPTTWNYIGQKTLNANVVNVNEGGTTVTGTTAGTALWTMPFQAPGFGGYKKVCVYLNGYENTTATAQTITYPVVFNRTPAIVTDATSGGVSTTASVLTLPKSMGSAISGWVILEGF